MENDEHLDWEARRRPAAIGAAIFAALAPFVAIFPAASALQSPKNDNYLQLVFRYNAHRYAVILSSVIDGLGILASTFVLYYLFRAIRARKPEVSPAIGYLVLVGPILAAVTSTVEGSLQGTEAHTYIGTLHTNAAQTAQWLRQAMASVCAQPPKAACAVKPQIDAAQHYLQHAGPLQVSGFAGEAGLLLLAFAVVLVSLNGMRVGLLTRVVGIVGMVYAAISVIPQLLPPYVLGLFFFGALAVLFSGRWPNGTPPAWESGEARPWPSRQKMAEERARARGSRDAKPARNEKPDLDVDEDTDAVAAAAGIGTAHPSSKKRKRKRRR
jgi:hypothetical protein